MSKYGEGKPEWLPRIMVRRRGEETPLASTFVSVIEPHEGTARLRSLRRLTLQTPAGAALPESHVGVEFERDDGRRDIAVFADPASGDAGQPPEVCVAEHDMTLRGEVAFVTLGDGGVERLALSRAEAARVDAVDVQFYGPTDYIEMVFDGSGARVIRGDPASVQSITRDGNTLPLLP